MYVLHVAPFEATRYPPLLNTVHVSRSWGVDSAVVATTPIADRAPLGDAELVAPSAHLKRGALHAFLLQEGARIARRRGRPALIIGHNIYGLPAAAALAAAMRRPLVYHCHDFHDLRESRKHLGVLLNAVERSLSQLVTEMWVPVQERETIAVARRLRAPLRVVRNCPRLLPLLPPKGRLRSWLASQGSRSRGTGTLITRHGRLGPGHYVRELVELLPQLPHTTELVAIGEGDNDYMRACFERARALGVGDRFFLHPFVSHHALFELLVDGNVGSGLYGGTSDVNVATPAPNKVYENLALGVPVVVPSGGTLERDVALGGAGIAIDIGRIASDLVPAIERLSAEPKHGERGRSLHLRHLHYEAQLVGSLLDRIRPPAAAAAPSAMLDHA